MLTAVAAVIIVAVLLITRHLYLWRPLDSTDFYPWKPFFMGHRGVMTRAPENTLAAYAAALAAGLKGNELDVMATRDGVLVCSHNFDLERVTDGTGYIYERTYDYLRVVNAAVCHPAAGHQTIPRLEEVLDFFPPDFRLNIEVKTRGLWDILPALQVARLVRRRRLQKRTIVSCFNPLALLGVKWVDETILTGLLVENETWPLLRLINLARPDCLHPEAGLVTDDLLRFVRQRGLALNVWTVNNRPAIDWLIKRGVDGIITDRPEYCQL